MNATARKTIPVQWVSTQLAINERQAFTMLGLDDDRPERAKKDAFYKIRKQHGIPTLPGGVFPLAKLEKALNHEADDRHRTRIHTNKNQQLYASH